MNTREELEAAASDVIQILKTTEFASARVAVFGGLALWKYTPEYRTTEDVDLVINVDTAPESVKRTLLRLHSSSFEQRSQYFYYKSPIGKLVQIDICASWQSPYLAPACRVISTIADGEVPYISPTDLIIFKIVSCGLRAEPLKKSRDEADARRLLEQESSSGHLNLTSEQRQAAERGLPDLVKISNKNEAWWRQHLGL